MVSIAGERHICVEKHARASAPASVDNQEACGGYDVHILSVTFPAVANAWRCDSTCTLQIVSRQLILYTWRWLCASPSIWDGKAHLNERRVAATRRDDESVPPSHGDIARV